MSQNRSSAVMQRAEAITVGQKWYFTGEPCLHGHIARRWVVNRECHHCVNARRRVRRAIDPAPYRAKENADGAALVERVNKLAKDATEIGKKLDGLGIICDRVERSLKA
jgi:hypothetical protein